MTLLSCVIGSSGIWPARRTSPRSSRPLRSEHLGPHRVTVSILLCLAMMTALCTNFDDSDVD
eukprot:6572863-Pyramimonas_sp.AAC.1